MRSVPAVPPPLDRPWLADRVHAALGAPDCRFVVLTGAPGIGKSTFVAQLARDNPDWASYLVRRDQRTARADSGVRSFLTEVGFQLAAAHPELFEPRQLSLAVEQRIGRSSGEVVGAEVRRLLASPFHRQVAIIRQRVRDNPGRTVGLRVDELVADPAGLTVDQLQQLALLAPAAAARALDPGLRLVVLVDAVDELRYQRSEEPLLDWLAGVALPDNVRFVLTTRPADSQVEHLLTTQRPVLLDLDTMTEPLRTDAHAYATRTWPTAPAPVLDQLLTKAAGNLGYLDAFARTATDPADLPELLAGTPDELTALHGFFLNQLRTRLIDRLLPTADDKYLDAWTAALRPALAVLAVAYEPLTLPQLHRLARSPLDPADFATAVDWLLPFLHREQDRFRLYHASVREFLLAAPTALRVDERTWHRRLADRYWQDLSDTGEPADDYGIRTLARHLSDAGDERLRELLDLPWLELRHRHDGAHYAGFLNDLALGEQAAHDDPAELFRLRMIRAQVHEQVGRYDDDDLYVLTLLGWAAEAVQHARSRPTPEAVAQSLTMVGEARLRATGTVPPELIAELRQLAEAMADPALQVLLRGQAAHWLAADRKPEAALAYAEARELAESLTPPTRRADALTRIGLTMAMDEVPGGAEALDHGVRAALAAPDDGDYIWRQRKADNTYLRDWTLRDLVAELAGNGFLQHARQLAEAIPDRTADRSAEQAWQLIAEAEAPAEPADAPSEGVLLIENGEHDRVRQLGEQLAEPDRIALFRDLAGELAFREHPDAAEVWAWADELIAPPMSPTPVAEVLAELAQAAPALFPLVTELAQAAPERDQILVALAHSHCVARNFAAVRELLPGIEDREHRRQAHRHLVVGLQEAGDWAGALAAAIAVRERDWHQDCRWVAGIACLRNGAIQEGIRYLRRLNGAFRIQQAIAGGIRALLAREELATALRFPQLVGWRADEATLDVWAEVLAETGFPDALIDLLPADTPEESRAALASAAARSARHEALTAQLLDGLADQDRADGIRYLAAAQAAKHGDLAAAHRWIAATTGPMLAALASARVACETARRTPEQAEPLLRQAEQAVSQLPEHDRLLPNTALCATRYHLHGPAESTVDELTAVLREDDEPHALGADFERLLAVELADAGDPRGLRLIQSPEAVSLHGLVVSLHRSGLFDAALQAAEAETLDRDDCFASVSHALTEAGQCDRALEVARRIIEPDRRAIAIGIVCDALVAQDRLTEAIHALDGSPDQLLRALPRWAGKPHGPDEAAMRTAILRAAEVLAWTDPGWAEVLPALTDALTTPA